MTRYLLNKVFQIPVPFLLEFKVELFKLREKSNLFWLHFFHRDIVVQILSNFDNENDGAWREKQKKNVLDA